MNFTILSFAVLIAIVSIAAGFQPLLVSRHLTTGQHVGLKRKSIIGQVYRLRFAATDASDDSSADFAPTPAATSAADFAEDELESDEIKRLKRSIESTKSQIEETKREQSSVAQRINELDAEFGEEITRIKKEFSRMKERAFQESQLAVDTAKIDAVKDVLSVADNYLRAKSVFKTLETENEQKIIDTYDAVFESFNQVLNDFGLLKVESVGKPFDFNFMEAITAQPSTQYKKDTVMMEYQVGYRMGERCVRPSMVVVSQGPGPASS